MQPEDYQAVLNVLDNFSQGAGFLSGFYKNFLGGECVRKFEEEFARYIGVKHAVAVTSGTAALHTAIEAAFGGRTPSSTFVNQPVLTTPYTFVASASAILMAHQTPVFGDIDRDTFNLDPTTYHTAYRQWLPAPTPKAVVAVHLLGQPMNLEGSKRQFPLATIIEDCAQALGATWRHRKVGSLGDLGCFSQATKILTPAGKKRIKDLKIGDEVWTPLGSKKVLETHKRTYNGKWVRLRFGKLDTALKVSTTAEHPIFIYRNGIKQWMPADQVKEGDEVFMPTKKCNQCEALVPEYRKLCEKCYQSQTIRARQFQRELHLVTGERLKKSTDNHFTEDIAPVMARFQAEGYRTIPLIKPEPDFIAIKGDKIIAVEVESKVTPRLSKIEQWAGVGYYDDLVWVTKEPKKRSDVYGHASYAIDEFEGNAQARVPVLKVEHYSNKRNKNVSVYNLTIDGTPVYYAQGILVHNCFSFQETKTLTTLGEGGMITTNRDDLAELCRNIRNHGEKYGKQPYLGYNYRMTEAAAAFGLAQLRRLDSTLRTQIRCAEIVRNNLPEGLHPLPVPTTTKPSFFIVAALTDNSFNREDWVAKAQSKLFNGVSKPGETIGLGYAELIPDLPFFLFLNKPSIPVARETIKRTVWFDVHRFVSEEIVRARVDALKEIK